MNDAEAVATPRSGFGSSLPPSLPLEISYSHFFEFGTKNEEVKRWYQSLKEEHGVPLEFMSIAYMKDQDTNFKHEFLLFYLLPVDSVTSDDYSFVCRVERMGNGSRPRALFTGDYAHDTVKIFSRDAYTRFELSYPPQDRARCVLNIRLQRRLDLLRILELCHTVQHSDISARYTLFQFNCYFMCWMILVNVIRGIDRWGDRLEPDTWGRIVNQQLLDALIDTQTPQDLTDPPPTIKDPRLPQNSLDSIAQYLCFRAFTAIGGPESDPVVGKITHAIQDELESARNHLLDVIDSHNSTVPFPSDTQLYEAIKKGISTRLDTVVTKVLRQDVDKCGDQKLWSLLSNNKPPNGNSTGVFSSELEARAAKKLHKMWFGYIWSYLDSGEFWSVVQNEIEYKQDSSALQKLYSEVKQLLEVLIQLPDFRIWGESYGRAVTDILGSCSNGARKSPINRSYLNFKHLGFYRTRILAVLLSSRADIQTAWEAISQDYRVLAIFTLLQLEPINQPNKLVEPHIWLRRCFKSNDWRYCLKRSVSKAIYDSLMLLDNPLLEVKQTPDGTRQMWRCTELYSFIQKRIKDHASRVPQSPGARSSQEVQDGIHNAIKEIWIKRPSFSEEISV